MFNQDRVFSQRNPDTGHMEWYFDTREGLMGPFTSEVLSRKALQNHIKHCISQNLDGGRKLGLKAVRLSIANN
jgi:hypothetical protein